MTRAFLRPRHFVFCAVVSALSAPLAAYAQNTNAASGESLAQAESLFREGKQAMVKKEYDHACRLFEESAKLDDSLGTRINLALCNEERGRVATAWAQYKEVEGRASKDTRNSEYQKVARSHADTLEPRISRLMIVVATGAAPRGLLVSIDGQPTSELLWAAGIPVDVGTHSIVATAAQKEPFRTTVRVDDESKTVSTEIPVLRDAPPDAPKAKEIPPPSVKPLEVLAAAEHIAAKRTQRTVGIVVGATGAAVTAAGLFFGGIALANLAEANNCSTSFKCILHKDTPLATGEQAYIDASRNARSRVDTWSTAATITVPIGLALTAVGVYFFIRSFGADATKSHSASIRFTPAGVQF